MKEPGVKFEISVGSTDWKYYLEADPQTISSFKEPLNVLVKTCAQKGPPPEMPKGSLKVFVDGTGRWQDAEVTTRVFREVWPEIMELLRKLSKEQVLLIYFAGLATHDDVLALLPYFPLFDDDDTRFYISETCKDSKNKKPASMWVCSEYSRRDFKKLTSADEIDFAYGTTIMGITASDDIVAPLLKKCVMNKETLQEVLQCESVECWWVCDIDFEGITIWHKSHSGKELAEELKEQVMSKFDYQVETHC